MVGEKKGRGEKKQGKAMGKRIESGCLFPEELEADKYIYISLMGRIGIDFTSWDFE